MYASDNSTLLRTVQRSLSSFNEAEACTPRITQRLDDLASHFENGFNEAEACTPRITRAFFVFLGPPNGVLQ